MSAAARRRAKQLQKRNTNGTTEDAISTQLRTLLNSEANLDEATAYEALQLAQSVIRKSVKAGDGAKLMDIAMSSVQKLIASCSSPSSSSSGSKTIGGVLIGMVSQLLVQTTEAMLEVRLSVNEESLGTIMSMDDLFYKQLSLLRSESAASGSNNDERSLSEENAKIQLKQRCKYLQKAIRWSDFMGDVRYGHAQLHSLIATALWEVTEYGDSVSHSALAEEPAVINERLVKLDNDNEKDVLLCRAVLVMLTTENMRDANELCKLFIASEQGAKSSRNFDKFASEFLSKESKQKSYVIFATSVLGICEREKKAGALYTWLLGKFQAYLQKKPELLPYTTKIGQIYFNIQPPPSMLKQMESMMAMMGGLGGAGGMPGMFPPGAF